MSPTFICGGVMGAEGMGLGADPNQTRGQLLSPLKAARAGVANHTPWYYGLASHHGTACLQATTGQNLLPFIGQHPHMNIDQALHPTTA